MSRIDILETVKEMKEYMEMKDALQRELDILRDQAIKWLLEHDCDEVMTDAGKITYREVVSRRFDTTALKKDHDEIYAAYTRVTSCMKFTCNQEGQL